MVLELFTVDVNSVQQSTLITKLKKTRFLDSIAAELDRDLDKVLYEVVRDNTRIYEAAAKSAVPIHKTLGGTLRDYHIRTNYAKISRSKPVGRVYVDDLAHQPLYNFNSVTRASDLARDLDLGEFTNFSTGFETFNVQSKRSKKSVLGQLLGEGETVKASKLAPSRTRLIHTAIVIPFAPQQTIASSLKITGISGVQTGNIRAGLFKRSRFSEPEQGFFAVGGTTAGWISNATEQYNIASFRYFSGSHDLQAFAAGAE